MTKIINSQDSKACKYNLLKPLGFQDKAHMIAWLPNVVQNSRSTYSPRKLLITVIFKKLG